MGRTQSSIGQALQQNTQILDAWRSWFTANNFVGDPDAALRKLQPALWRAFCRSSQAQQLGVTLPPYDASTRQDPAPIPQPIPQPDPVSHPIPDPVCSACNKPATTSIALCQCGQCAACCDCAMSDPDPTPQPQPLPIPQPIPAPVPVSSNPLLALIAQGLEEMGFQAHATVPPSDFTQLAHEAVLQVIEELEQAHKLQKTPLPSILVTAKTPAKRVPRWYGRMRRLVSCRVNVLLVGPAGSGKTTAAAMLAAELELPFYRVSLSAGVDEGILQGWLLPIEIGGQFAYVPSVMVTAYECGGVVLIDEMDSADPNMLIILNAALDNGAWFIPSRHGEPELQRHADFIVIGAANTWGHGRDRKYTGAQCLDERTLSRFRSGQVACDYDPDLETDLFDASIVEIGHILRERCRAIAEFGRDISTRDIENAHVKLAAFSPEEVWYEYFQDWAEDELHRIHVALDHNTMTVCVN